MVPPPVKERANSLVERAASKQNVIGGGQGVTDSFSKLKLTGNSFVELKNNELEVQNKNNKENIGESGDKANSDTIITNNRGKLSQKSRPKPSRKSGRIEPSSPNEFFHMGSLKSHAMAGKTQTASKLAGNGSQLMADLLAKGGTPKDEENSVDRLAEDLEKVSVKEIEGVDLMVRGPVRVSRPAVVCVPPYPQMREPQLHLRNGMGPQVISPQLHWQSQKNKAKPNSGYGQQQSIYECYVPACNNENGGYCEAGNMTSDDQPVMISSGGDLFNEGYAVPSFALHPNCSQSMGSPTPSNYSPCSMRDDMTPPTMYGGPREPQQQVVQKIPVNPFADGYLNTEELNRLLNVPEELPEALSDFILKYSRRYSADTPPMSSNSDSTEESQPSSRKNSASDSSTSSSPKHMPGFRPRSSTDEGSVCNSPMSAGSAPQRSPAAPKGGQTPGTPSGTKPVIGNAANKNGRYKPILPKQLQSNRKGKARDRLLNMFSESQKEAAWIWAMKCVQSCPGALYYRDPDGDSLLHIVVWHRDLAKVYALVEQMLKTEYTPCRKPFDLPNRLHETPLFLAVEKRAEELVSYLLECGANPNYQTRRSEMDAAIHYAAARGMAEIVSTLCSCPATDKNLRNGLGLTPLLCGVKNHGVIEEESQCLVNNKPTIRALLKSGSDPKIPDATNGKTVIHYSVERMDPELVEIFRDNLDKEEMRHLVNLPCYNGETVVSLLGRMSTGPRSGTGLGRFEAEDELRRKMFLTLVNCGAEVTAPGDDALSTEGSTGDPASPFTALSECA